MPRFEPFAGLRYAPAVPIDDVIAPPYDVVAPDERARLATRHSANAIRVELPVDDPRADSDRYQVAAGLLGSWIDRGILVADEAPAFYVCRMTDPGGATTTGVIGALGLEPSGGDVLPHEETTPKDKSDRLQLLRAAHANVSPIWGLSLTDGLAKAYEPFGPPDRVAHDDEGVEHALWVVDDPAAVEAITVGVDASPVVIADGHHRYETALAYRQERRAANDGRGGPYDLVMAFVVELAEEQLAVRAIHRTLAGMRSPEDLLETFQRWFDTVQAGTPDERLIEAVAGSEALALVTSRGVWLLTPRPQAYEAAGSELDSSLVALAAADLPGVTVGYEHDWRVAVGTALHGGAEAAVLLRPVTVAQISQWAHARRRMPPKSTYFHPKPRTGMVFRPVEG